MPYDILIQNIGGLPSTYTILICEPGPAICVPLISSVQPGDLPLTIPYSSIPAQFQPDGTPFTLQVQSEDPNYQGDCEPLLVFNQTQTPTPTETSTPTPTPTINPEVSPSQTPTVTPTINPEVSPSQTPTVTPTSTECCGDWFYLSSRSSGTTGATYYITYCDNTTQTMIAPAQTIGYIYCAKNVVALNQDYDGDHYNKNYWTQLRCTCVGPTPTPTICCSDWQYYAGFSSGGLNYATYYVIYCDGSTEVRLVPLYGTGTFYCAEDVIVIGQFGGGSVYRTNSNCVCLTATPTVTPTNTVTPTPTRDPEVSPSQTPTNTQTINNLLSISTCDLLISVKQNNDVVVYNHNTNIYTSIYQYFSGQLLTGSIEDICVDNSHIFLLNNNNQIFKYSYVSSPFSSTYVTTLTIAGQSIDFCLENYDSNSLISAMGSNFILINKTNGSITTLFSKPINNTSILDIIISNTSSGTQIFNLSKTNQNDIYLTILDYNNGTIIKNINLINSFYVSLFQNNDNLYLLYQNPVINGGNGRYNISKLDPNLENQIIPDPTIPGFITGSAKLTSCNDIEFGCTGYYWRIVSSTKGTIYNGIYNITNNELIDLPSSHTNFTQNFQISYQLEIVDCDNNNIMCTVDMWVANDEEIRYWPSNTLNSFCGSFTISPYSTPL